MRRTIKLLLMATTVMYVSCSSSKKTTTNFASDFPSGTSPEEVGKRIALRYLSLPYQNFNRPTPPKYILPIPKPAHGMAH